MLDGDRGGVLRRGLATCTMPEKRAGTAPASLDVQQAEAQLELKDRALAASAEGITIADARLPDNPLIYVNAGFERITGYTAGEVLGRNCRFLQGPGTDIDTLNELRTAIREQRAVTVQLLNYRKDGRPFWNRLSITPVRDAGGVVTHFIGVQSDVTAEKQARDELQRANERLEAASLAMKQDLQAAEEVQRSLLPAELPAVAGLGFAYKFRPCSDVGGDSLNVIELDERSIGVYILDVSGHGVAAALLSVSLSHILAAPPDRSFLFHAAPEGGRKYTISPPAEVVGRLNRQFAGRAGRPQYFTMIYGIIDTLDHTFRYAAAGHLGPIHMPRGGAPRVLETGGLPVGLIRGAAFQESRITLAAGDRLFLCTDGLYEAENREGEEYGVERLLIEIERSRNMPLIESLNAVMGGVEAWAAPEGPRDDASMMAIERGG